MAHGKPHFTWPLESDLLSHCCKIPLEKCYFGHPSLGGSCRSGRGADSDGGCVTKATSPKFGPFCAAPCCHLNATNELLVVASFEPLLSPLVCTGVFRNELRPITAAFQTGKTKVHPATKQADAAWQALALFPSARGVQCHSPAFCSHQGRGKPRH